MTSVQRIMNLNVPDVNELLEMVVEVTLFFDGCKNRISEWVEKHRQTIEKNQKLLICRGEENDIRILLCMLRDLLVRATKSERGNKVYEELLKNIETKKDLIPENYREILTRRQKKTIRTNAITCVATRIPVNRQLRHSLRECSAGELTAVREMSQKSLILFYIDKDMPKGNFY